MRSTEPNNNTKIQLYTYRYTIYKYIEVRRFVQQSDGMWKKQFLCLLVVVYSGVWRFLEGRRVNRVWPGCDVSAVMFTACFLTLVWPGCTPMISLQSWRSVSVSFCPVCWLSQTRQCGCAENRANNKVKDKISFLLYLVSFNLLEIWRGVDHTSLHFLFFNLFV